MSIPCVSQRKAGNRPSEVNLNKVFLAMAYDLRVHSHPEVLDAHSRLANGQYLGFLRTLDDMTSQQYTSIADERFRLHQLAALLSKFPFRDPAIDRKKVAIDKFLKAEHRCKRINQKLRSRRSRVEPPHMQFMRDWIATVIGNDVPYDAIYANCDFGPGSSIGTHGADTTVIAKLNKLTVTPTAFPVAYAALASNLHYRDVLCGSGISGYDGTMSPGQMLRLSGLKATLVQYNKITCVPKNAKTDRTIAIEPALNGFIQTGVDKVLRTKLRRVGVDLSSQKLNQALARIGSRDGNYSTIDLSAASDSMSIQLVKELLPSAWFSFLDAIRSPSYVLDKNTPVRYEKFCSMGNGFCFPLETLIFRAAVEYVMSVCAFSRNRTCAVYGDDIIVPYECALLLIEVLRDLGFATNVDKTFVVGPFKESCGADYYFGANVRPLFIKKPLTGPIEIYPLLNALYERKLLHTWQVVFDHLPGHKRFLRPYVRDDDTAVTAPMDLFMGSKHAKWNRQTQAWNWKRIVITQTAGTIPRTDEELMAGKLRGDLNSSEWFAHRFSDATRVQVGT